MEVIYRNVPVSACQVPCTCNETTILSCARATPDYESLNEELSVDVQEPEHLTIVSALSLHSCKK